MIGKEPGDGLDHVGVELPGVLAGSRHQHEDEAQVAGAVAQADVPNRGLAVALERSAAGGAVLPGLDKPNAAFAGDLVDIDPRMRHAAPMICR